jgi:hypothetical protein
MMPLYLALLICGLIFIINSGPHPQTNTHKLANHVFLFMIVLGGFVSIWEFIYGSR